jgi:uncharacterized protein YidB (DUF937 family)
MFGGGRRPETSGRRDHDDPSQGYGPPDGYEGEEGYGEPPGGGYGEPPPEYGRRGGGRGRRDDPSQGYGPPDGYEGDEGYGEPPEGMGAPPYPGPGGGYGGPPPDYGRRGGGRGGRDDGGFLDEIGSMLDGPGGAPRGRGGQGRFDADAFGGGFEDLQRRFHQAGQGELMESWISPGANREASPEDLERALGPGTIEQLSRQTGIERGELLEQLSRALPQVIDGLTPNGRIPTPQEQRSWI